MLVFVTLASHLGRHAGSLSGDERNKKAHHQKTGQTHHTADNPHLKGIRRGPEDIL